MRKSRFVRLGEVGTPGSPAANPAYQCRGMQAGCATGDPASHHPPYSTILRNHSGIATDFCFGKSTHTVVAPPLA